MDKSIPQNLSDFFKGISSAQDDKSNEHTRICPDCRIKWKYIEPPSDCPNCKKNPFFSMRVGDIGCCVYLESSGLNLSDFKHFESPEKL